MVPDMENNMPRARRKPSKLKPLGDGRCPTADYDLGSPRGFEVSARKIDASAPVSGKGSLRVVPSARAGQPNEIRPVNGDANGRKYRRHLHPVEVMQSKGMLSKKQMIAGVRLSDAWEACFKSPGTDFSADRIDVSKKPDQAITIHLDRQEKYSKLIRSLPRDSVKVCHHVCCLSLYLRDGFSRNAGETIVALECLQMGLDVLYDTI